MGSLDYHVIQVGLGAEDGEKRLQELEDAVKRGEHIKLTHKQMDPLGENLFEKKDLSDFECGFD